MELGESRTILVIRVSDSRVLQIVARSLFLAIVIVTLPMLIPTIRSMSRMSESDINLLRSEALPVVFRDLADQGHLKNGDKGLVLSGRTDVEFGIFDGVESEVVKESDLPRQERIRDGVFDFVFASSLENGAFIDRVTKTGGLVVSDLTDYRSTDLFLGDFDYKIVYVRQFGSTVLGMKKVGPGKRGSSKAHFRNRRLLGSTPYARKLALKGLEDVMLEPPTEGNAKNFRYLPDLLGDDSLSGYEKRMFINVGSHDEKKHSLKWFLNNYPTKNHAFETYHLNVAAYRSRPRVSDWLIENVQEHDFVVMKAEAGAVEEMVERKAMHLVDELFLECRNQWRDGEDDTGKNTRAYWECLALYGRLIDAGVAVHQWWG
uniref:DUF7870 domain-containing protein n=1 Tax=Kalanchoe fedtschenkoi TaxID=63787 RepID=A0A7N0TW21_KALFE